MNPVNIATPLQLGTKVLRNRLVKAPMVEGLGTQNGDVSDDLIRLYSAWARGGIGMLITGNFMVDRRALGDISEPVLDNITDLTSLSRLASVGKEHGVIQIVQISHPGKQCPRGLNKETVAPSAIGFSNNDLKPLFGIPRAMSEEEILNVIWRFGEAAYICEKAGFDGVEIHGAHGYLISQFLSPLHNIRADQWGGNLENRMRFLVSCYQEVRKRTSSNFIVGVKLNSADFQKGGFSEEESMIVCKCLDALGVDFIEISGGTYEAAGMFDASQQQKKTSTIKREAYFLDFSEKIRKEVKMTLMLTGGFRTPEGMNTALSSGACDLIGIGRPLAMDASVGHVLMSGGSITNIPDIIKTGIPILDRTAGLEVPWYAEQFKAIAKGKKTNPQLSPLLVLIKMTLRTLPVVIKTKFRKNE